METTTETMVVMKDLTKMYGDFYAVKDVNIELKKGEFLTLLGPSGSGKTTTLKMVAGLEQPTAGEITVAGHNITFLPPNLRGLGMVFQNYALFPHMKVKDNVAFGLRMKKPKISEDIIKEKVDKMLGLVQLDGYQERYPSQLSGGQQQRVALARALVFDPPIVLMDEPLGALDKKLRSSMQLEIKRIQKAVGITTIYVTHDQEEALTMSDRIAIMRDGEIAQIDTAKNIYEHPNSSFIADFIGESNFMPVEVAERNGDEVVLRIKSAKGSTFTYTLTGTEPNLNEDFDFVIRPEKISIGKDLGDKKKLTGVVSEVVYLGETIKYVIKIDDQFYFSAKEQTISVKAHLQAGEEVQLGWDTVNAKLLV